MVPLTFHRVPVGLREDGRNLRGFQVACRSPSGLLERHTQDFGALQRERAARVPTTKEKKLRSAASRQLRVLTDARRSFSMCCRKASTSAPVRCSRAESRDRLLSMLGDESQEQAPGIAIRQDGAVRGVALLDQPFVKEGMQQLR